MEAGNQISEFEKIYRECRSGLAGHDPPVAQIINIRLVGLVKFSNVHTSMDKYQDNTYITPLGPIQIMQGCFKGSSENTCSGCIQVSCSAIVII
jgi:hypothetical protein